MKYQIQNLWPTKILITDNFLQETYVKNIKNQILSIYNKDQTNWQSGPNLHEQETFKVLSDEIKKISSHFLINAQKQIFEDLIITSMWANILKTGEFHRPHTHSNNTLSGVFYVQANSEKSAKIYFTDPRPQAAVLSPDFSEYNGDNCYTCHYPSITNRLILFPSWLNHYVETNSVNEDRISVSFNLMYKGKLGNSKYLQSNIF
jgi:uncharacterized protein (TIGR02466 family)